MKDNTPLSSVRLTDGGVVGGERRIKLLGVIAVGIRPHCHGDSHSANPSPDGVSSAPSSLRQETVPTSTVGAMRASMAQRRMASGRPIPPRSSRRGHVEKLDQVLVVQPRLIPLARYACR